MSNRVYTHLTCTGNSKYGSGNGREHATITTQDLKRYFGCLPTDEASGIIMCEQLLAQDRPRRGR